MIDVPDSTRKRVAEALYDAAISDAMAGRTTLDDDVWLRMADAAVAAAAQPLEELPEYPFEVFMDILHDLEMSVRIPDNDKYQRTVARLNRPNVNDWLRDEPPEWVTRPVKDGKPDISALTAADVAEWIEGEAMAAEIAHATFDRREPPVEDWHGKAKTSA